MDRTVGNYLEQAPLFLVGLWAYAALVSVPTAAVLGLAWVASRCYYPFGFYYGPPLLFLSTLPGYSIIALFFWGLARAALTDEYGE